MTFHHLLFSLMKLMPLGQRGKLNIELQVTGVSGNLFVVLWQSHISSRS